jgi:broad specificity phosphatase PhoE
VILARHGESVFSAELRMNGDIRLACPLTPRGEEEARALGAALAGDEVALCVTSEFERTRQTADLALAGRDVPRLVLPELNDPRYGAFEGRTIDEYRAWADGVSSGDDAPGGGESRQAIVSRYVRGFRSILERDEPAILVVAHSLPIAYLLAARDGNPPGRRVPLVEHAHPYRFDAETLERSLGVLEAWLAAPAW